MAVLPFQTRHFTTWTLAPRLCSNSKKNKTRTYLPKKRHRSPGIWYLGNMGVMGEIKHKRHKQYPTHQQKQKRWGKHLFERAGDAAEERQRTQKTVQITPETRGRCCSFAVYVHQNKPVQAPAECALNVHWGNQPICRCWQYQETQQCPANVQIAFSILSSHYHHCCPNQRANEGKVSVNMQPAKLECHNAMSTVRKLHVE